MAKHPCPYSPEILVALDQLIQPGEHIHDPFAGTGVRLAALCDRIGATYSGCDIEVWPDHDPRVTQGDSTLASSYPGEPFTVCTSPVYLNKRLADYANGPGPNTKVKGRRDYGIALGRALHENNLARHTGRASRAAAYWRLHTEAAKHWGDRVILNVDLPISDGWMQVLAGLGYTLADPIRCDTQRYGGLANARLRAAYEVVIVATRPA